MGSLTAAPLPLVVRVLGFGGDALNMLGTALSGSCLCYGSLGLSTCPVVQDKT